MSKPAKIVPRRMIFPITFVAILLAAIIGWLTIFTQKQLDDRCSINLQGFNHIRNDSEWNLNENLLWGYYFTSKTKLQLLPLSWLLPVFGYRFVDLKFDEVDKNWWLWRDPGSGTDQN